MAALAIGDTPHAKHILKSVLDEALVDGTTHKNIGLVLVLQR